MKTNNEIESDVKEILAGVRVVIPDKLLTYKDGLSSESEKEFFERCKSAYAHGLNPPKLADQAMKGMKKPQTSFEAKQATDKIGVWEIIFLPSKVKVSIDLHEFDTDERIIAEIIRQVDSATI